jgi:hypothetical protein
MLALDTAITVTLRGGGETPAGSVPLGTGVSTDTRS